MLAENLTILAVAAFFAVVTSPYDADDFRAARDRAIGWVRRDH